MHVQYAFVTYKKVLREGRDLTLVAMSIMVPRALEAADQLAQEGIEVEVIDPRTLRPLDLGPMVESIKKTSRLMIVHEAVKMGGFGGEVAASIAESEAFGYLDAPIVRLAGRDMPIPYNRNLEQHTVPQVKDIVAKARELVQVRV